MRVNWTVESMLRLRAAQKLAEQQQKAARS